MNHLRSISILEQFPFATKTDDRKTEQHIHRQMQTTQKTTSILWPHGTRQVDQFLLSFTVITDLTVWPPTWPMRWPHAWPPEVTAYLGAGLLWISAFCHQLYASASSLSLLGLFSWS